MMLCSFVLGERDAAELVLLLLSFSTVPDDELPLGNGTTDFPVRSNRESPSGCIVSLLVLPDDCENAMPLVIHAAAKIDAEISNRLGFIMPPRKFITNLVGQPICQARSFKPCTEWTVK
jgi:hypothetical protein